MSDDELDLLAGLEGEEYEPRPTQDVAQDLRNARRESPDQTPGSDLVWETTAAVWQEIDDATRKWFADHVNLNDLQEETFPLVKAALEGAEEERQRQEAEEARLQTERHERERAERQRQATERRQRSEVERQKREIEREKILRHNRILREATGVPEPSKTTIECQLQPLELRQDDAFEFGGPDDRQAPTLLRRTDGRALIYSGLTHSIAGESESGKTWLALWIAKEFIDLSPAYAPKIAQALGAPGPSVAYLDFEQNRSQYVERLPAIGIQQTARFQYGTPQLSADTFSIDHDLMRLLKGRPLPSADSAGSTSEWVTPIRLVIIDDVSQAMSAMGYGDSNAAVTAWQNQLPNRLAARGITVVMLDHLVKANDGTGRYPLGGVMKLNGVTGAQYIVTAVKPISPGLVGETEIRVGKDRPGRVRCVASEWREYDKTARVGRLIHDARDPLHVVMRIEPPTSTTQRLRKDLDTRILSYLAVRPGANLRELKAALTTSTPTLDGALSRLQASKQIREEKGPRNARLFYPL